MPIQNSVPSGIKLTTYDPHHPEWDNNTPEQDSALDRNYYGFLIEAGTKHRDKQLMILTGGDDSQEQTASRMVVHLARELLSGSQLANKLLRRFSFLVIPIHSQQATRDGFSRFGFDGPYDSLANGGSLIGEQITSQAIQNWIVDHPNPDGAFWGNLAWHCDNLNQLFLTKRPSDNSGDPSIPVSPYCFVTLGTIDTPEAQLQQFLGDGTKGYTHQGWSELVKPTQIVKGGASGEIDNEMPWRHAGNKASFFYEEDALQQTAVAYLEGIATLVGATIPVEPEPAIGVAFGAPQPSLTFRKQFGAAAVGVATGITATTTVRHIVNGHAGIAAGVTATLTHRHQANVVVGLGIGLNIRTGKLAIPLPGEPRVGVGFGISTALTHVLTLPGVPRVCVAFGTTATLTQRGSGIHVRAAIGIGLRATFSTTHKLHLAVSTGFGVRTAVVNRTAQEALSATRNINLSMSMTEVVGAATSTVYITMKSNAGLYWNFLTQSWDALPSTATRAYIDSANSLPNTDGATLECVVLLPDDGL